MAKKPTDSEIISLLKDGVSAGIKFNDTKLSVERRRVMEYYNGRLPAPVHGGNSKYVSTDVFDCLESMKATLLETFSAHADIVQFSAKNDDDLAEAAQASAYTKHVIFEQNDGTELFGSIFHDGLSSRNAIIQVHWEDKTERVPEEFKDQSEDSLAVLLADDGVDIEEIEIDPQTGLVSGSLTREERKAQVRIELIPPEEFIVNPNIKSLFASPQLSRRTEKSKSDLIKEGYPKAKVKELSTGDNELSLESERVQRFSAVSTSFGNNEERQEASKLFTVYETYAWLDLDNRGSTALWRIVHSGNTVLEKEVVERHPFLSFAPLPIPHSFYGTNFSTKVIPVQNAKTILTRSILDHAVLANNPRYGVEIGRASCRERV